MGELGGLGEEQVLHHEMVEAAQQVHRVFDVGLRLRRVLAEAVDGAQLAALHRLEHLRQVLAVARRHGGVPRRVELGARLVVDDVLEAGQAVGDGPHVAAALHVVLPAQRVQPAAGPAHMAAEEREVDEREHVVDAGVVLGDAERPAHLGAVGAGVGVSEGADVVGRHARLGLGGFERPWLDVGGELGEAGGGPLDERLVHEAGMDDLARYGLGERDVGTDVDRQPALGPRCGCRAPRIDDEDAGATTDGREHVMEEDRMGLTRVRTPQDDHVRGLDVLVGRRATTGSEHCRQTDDARSVSSSVAGIDVVRADRDAHELLGEEVHLVRRLRAREHAEGVGPVLVSHLAEAGGGGIERLVPRRRAQHAVAAHEWLGDAR